MNSVMLASFRDELCKIAEGNVAAPVKTGIGDMGSNVMGKPFTSSGIGASDSVKGLGTPKPAKPTNYSMVHSNAPMAASDAGASSKMVPPPPVRT